MSDKLTKESVLDVLSVIIDPEMKISIVELGLIYDVRIEETESGNNVEVDMTLTSIACPIGPTLRSAVHHKVEKIPGVKDVIVNLIFDPPWDVRVHASEDAQMELGII